MRWTPWPLAAALVALLVATPLLVVAASLLTPSLEVWRHLWQTQLPGLIAHTLALMAGVGLGAGGLGTGLAWLVATYRFPGHAWLEWLLVLPLAVPTYVMGFVFLGLFDYAGPVQRLWRGLFGAGAWFPEVASYGGVVGVMSLVLYPYVYVLARAAFLAQSATLLEAARALGARRAEVFWRVALPLARPAIAAGVALAVMEALADFGTVAIYNYPTFTVAIYRVWFGLFDRGAATELAALLLTFTLTLFFLERWLRGQARFAAGSSLRPRQPVRLRGWRAGLATAAATAVVAVAFGLPVGQLLGWTLASVGGSAYDAHYLQLVRNTVLLAALTAVVALVAAVVVAYGLRLSRSRFVAFCGRLATLGYALPGSVIAVGVLGPLSFLDRTLDGWLRATWGVSSGLLLTGSFAGLVFAYVVRFLAISCQAVEAGLAAITPSMDMAGRSLGATAGGVLWRLHLPLLRGGLCGAALLVFVDVMKEMPATLLLRPFGYNTLAVRIWELTSESLWEAAALPALTLVAAGLLPVAVLVRRSRRPGAAP